jgi:hypothetical protein
MRFPLVSAVLLTTAMVILFALPKDGGLLAWMPSESEVSTHFEKRHRDLKVDVTAGEGDSDHRVYMIDYSSLSDGMIYHAGWSVHSSGCLYGWRIDEEDLNLKK